ncbi:primary-amine oxidase [Nocardia sp. NPDC050175]|uniref:primary-amine oxidase n=1 Tax=Nocardia sp. NPDC050175 TaxID=3364317 RepID=UPI0037A73146
MTAHDRHPLAPLTATELRDTVAIVRRAEAVAMDGLFVWCALDEPTKQQVLELDTIATPLERRALCAIYDRKERQTKLVTVSLTDQKVVHVELVSRGEAQILNAEWFNDAAAIKRDPNFQEALLRRGVTDLDTVRVEPWPAGNFGTDLDRTGRRLGRGVAYVVERPGDNPYTRPIENLVAVIDRDTGEIVELLDGEAIPLPADPGRYDGTGSVRHLAPLRITQPSGVGFDVSDGHVRWGPWRLRVSMHPLEGLVLHDIRYDDAGRKRPIIYRASVAEMVVPYSSTSINHWWKNAFDIGECGLGKAAASLELGCDCLGEITYVDVDMLDEDGSIYTMARAICLHEEDYGVLWRHKDVVTGVTEVRRSRRLVLSAFSTVGNYDYGFFWYFYLDGTIQAEVKLTGVILTQASAPDARPRYANPVAPGLAGPHHQHLFGFRMDFFLDGPNNTVYEVDAVAEPFSEGNPYGTAFVERRTRLDRESGAARFAAPERARSWLVTNQSSRNVCGEPVGYRLIPTHAAALLAQPESPVSRRAGFATRHLWVTAFDRNERRPAGDFPNQHAGGDGLPRWVVADRELVDTDIVLWHTAGSTHFARPEDFPVMPCDYIGFTLKPSGFFDRNPALDLAAPNK